MTCSIDTNYTHTDSLSRSSLDQSKRFLLNIDTYNLVPTPPFDSTSVSPLAPRTSFHRSSKLDTTYRAIRHRRTTCLSANIQQPLSPPLEQSNSLPRFYQPKLPTSQQSRCTTRWENSRQHSKEHKHNPSQHTSALVSHPQGQRSQDAEVGGHGAVLQCLSELRQDLRMQGKKNTNLTKRKTPTDWHTPELQNSPRRLRRDHIAQLSRPTWQGVPLLLGREY